VVTGHTTQAPLGTGRGRTGHGPPHATQQPGKLQHAGGGWRRSWAQRAKGHTDDTSTSHRGTQRATAAHSRLPRALSAPAASSWAMSTTDLVWARRMVTLARSAVCTAAHTQREPRKVNPAARAGRNPVCMSTRARNAPTNQGSSTGAFGQHRAARDTRAPSTDC
jgi:hypothetical protein